MRTIAGRGIARPFIAGETLVEIVEESRAARCREWSDPLASLGWVPLDPLLDGDLVTVEPSILKREDRRALFYPGELGLLFGDSGSGKGWVACFAAAQVLRAGGVVIYLDLEDSPESIVLRLRTLGITDDVLRSGRFLYYGPEDDVTPEAAAALAEKIAAIRGEFSPVLVLIDSVGEAFGLAGINENTDAEVAPWLATVARPLADAGAAVILIDHVTKAGEQPLHPSGSKRKRAAVAAAYRVDAVAPLSKETGGRVRLTCGKDRHGSYVRGDRVADLVAVLDPLGASSWHLYEPHADDAPTKGPDPVAAAILDVLDDADGPLSITEIRAHVRDRLDVRASNARIAETLGDLAALGDLAELPGPGRSRRFARPETPDETSSATPDETTSRALPLDEGNTP